MTVTAGSRVREHDGNGITTTFNGPMSYVRSDVAAYIIESGVSTKLPPASYDVDYLGRGIGTRVRMSVAPTVGQKLRLIREMPYEQDVDITNQSAFLPEVLEKGMDVLAMQIQQLADRQERGLYYPEDYPGDIPDMRLPPPESQKLLGWNFAGDALRNVDLDPNGAGDLLLRSDLADPTGGGNLVAFRQLGTGAATRDIMEKLREVISLRDYYQVADGANWVPAFNRALVYLSSGGGGRLYIPAGTYPVTGSIDISGYDNIWIDGCGQDNTIITTNSPVAPIILSNADRKYRKFTNFTLTSSVTRTSGAHMDFLVERRSVIEDVKITEHFDGINMRGYEECEIKRVRIVKPSGYGRGLVIGTFGLFGAGANLHVIGVFIRGGNDLTADPPVGSLGIQIYDCDAVYMIDTDVGGCIDGNMNINSSVRTANFFFNSCYFDATKNGHCITVQGAGTKDKWAFTGCWIGGGGILPGGANDACSILFADHGSYNGIQLANCRFHLSKGSGVNIGRAGEFSFTGCFFQQNGSGGSGNQYGFKYAPSSAIGPGPLLSGCYFSGNTPKAIQTTANAREVVIEGCSIDNGVDISPGTTRRATGFDKAGNSYASASTMTISPFHDFIVVNGTTNISTIQPTYAGHRITIFFTGVLTVIDGSGGIRLNGAGVNYTTAGGSTLTLSCDGSEWIENSRTST